MLNTDIDNFLEDIKDVLSAEAEREIEENPYIAERENLSTEEEKRAYINERVNDTGTLGLNGIKGYNTDNGRKRLIGVLRAWYLYNNMSEDEILSLSEENIEKKREFNRKFAQEFKMPIVPKNLTQQEIEQDETLSEKTAEYNKKIDENFKKYLNLIKVVGKIKFNGPDIGEGFNEDSFFNDAEKFTGFSMWDLIFHRYFRI